MSESIFPLLVLDFGMSEASISHIAIEVKREEEKNCPKAVRQTHIIITDTLLWVNVICTP